MSLSMVLPYPPTLNKYYRNWRGRTVISGEGREFRETVFAIARGRSVAGPLKLKLIVHPPDKRKRDLDNLLKATLDAMQHAGVYADDSLIHQLCIEKHGVVTNGMMFVFLEEIS